MTVNPNATCSNNDRQGGGVAGASPAIGRGGCRGREGAWSR